MADASKRVIIKKKQPIFQKALYKTWLEFTQLTTIQGVKYITDPKGRLYTRIIWIVVILTCLVFACSLVYIFYDDFMRSPTRLHIETDHVPLSELTFPAVTICSGNFISYIKTINLLKTLNLPNNTNPAEVMEFIKQSTGFRTRAAYNEEDLIRLQEIVNRNGYTIQDFMSSLRLSCDELLFRCRWHLKITECKDLFHKSLTYSGSCCSFNINQTGIEFLERKSYFFGISGGLSLIVRSLHDDMAISTVYSNGFKIIIHKPQIFPSEYSIEKLIAANTETMVTIRPTEIKCSEEVRQLQFDARDCVFKEERMLNFFNEYNDENCDFECQILDIIQLCECIPYYFLQQPGVATCNFTKIPCLVNNFNRTILKKTVDYYQCNCPANCQITTYDVHTTALPLHIHNFTMDLFYEGIGKNDSVLHVYMESQTFRRLRRDLTSNYILLICELLLHINFNGFSDSLPFLEQTVSNNLEISINILHYLIWIMDANFGNTFSLCLGMSVLSIVEIIYFFTIVLRRNYLQIRKELQQRQSIMRRLEKPIFRTWDRTHINHYLE